MDSRMNDRRKIKQNVERGRIEMQKKKRIRWGERWS